MRPRAESVVELANRIVPLRVVLERTNIHVPEFSRGKSVKARCPYADMYHLDADASRSMRVYSDSNTGFCYMGCGVLTPVAVHAKLSEMSYKAAAYSLLESQGHKFKTMTEKWAEYLNPVEDFSREGYREALVEFCSAYVGPDWSSRQYCASIASALGKALLVLDSASSVDQADRWLDLARSSMKHKIDKESEIDTSEELSEA